MELNLNGIEAGNESVEITVFSLNPWSKATLSVFGKELAETGNKCEGPSTQLPAPSQSQTRGKQARTGANKKPDCAATLPGTC